MEEPRGPLVSFQCTLAEDKEKKPQQRSTQVCLPVRHDAVLDRVLEPEDTAFRPRLIAGLGGCLIADEDARPVSKPANLQFGFPASLLFKCLTSAHMLTSRHRTKMAIWGGAIGIRSMYVRFCRRVRQVVPFLCLRLGEGTRKETTRATMCVCVCVCAGS